MTRTRARGILAATIALTAATATQASAQLTLRGGVNLTTFVGGDAEDVESRKGLNLGAAIPLFHFGPVAIVPEIYYAQKGAEQPATGGVLNPFEFRLDYIEVPVLARLNFGSGSLRPYLQAGPSFAWQLDCSISLDAVGTGNDDCGQSLNDELKDYDQGIVFGGGIDFGLAGIGALNLDARFERGLARITDNADLKNQAFTLMLGWQVGGPGMLR